MVHMEKNKIWKYPISYNRLITVVNAPKGAKILSVINQNGKLVAYALVDTSVEEHEEIIFAVIGTGRDISSGIDINQYTFLGTETIDSGEIACHVFYTKAR